MRVVARAATLLERCGIFGAVGESGAIRFRSSRMVDRKTGGTFGSRGAGAGRTRTQLGRGSNQFGDYLVTELMRMNRIATDELEK